MIPARTWGGHAVVIAPHRNIKIEEVDGSCSGEKEHNLAVVVHGSIRPRSRGGTLHLGHSVLDQKMAS